MAGEMSVFERSLNSIVEAFHQYSRREDNNDTLNKKEFKLLMQKELPSYLKKVDRNEDGKDVVKDIMEDLDTNLDNELSFEEAIMLFSRVINASHETMHQGHHRGHDHSHGPGLGQGSQAR
ncbi:protein S100-A9 isoform X2 [Fukomys damarensis]|uniref:Protein S100-A9 n=1 Tax=Fukomys damarensis TaxID=885580 RepID=A0A091D3Q6_FUKDA|nr:protein S100-A9 isoform X2 [Fukomys damarensis]KFO24860.1 Protein S100-A9 [Fukomys damarensis]